MISFRVIWQHPIILNINYFWREQPAIALFFYVRISNPGKIEMKESFDIMATVEKLTKNKYV